MKKFYRILALLLALCLFCTAASAAGITEEEEHNHGIVEESVEEAEEAELSMSVPVYEPAASTVETAEQGFEIPDRMTWTLDENGTLRIGGKGIIIPIHSAEEQPWAKVREEIREVYFEDDARLMIENIAHWFDGCVNLTYAELPAYVFAIGDHAFRSCAKLTELALFHAQTVEISPTAFEAVGGSDLCVYVRSEEAYAGASQAAWHGRSVVVVNLGAYDATTYSGYCMSGCNCSSCTWSWIIKQYDEDYHYKYAACDNCSANEYAYGTRIAHSFNSSGVCTECGYAQTVSCSHGSTYTTWSGCNWYRYCNYCDELLSSGVSHGTYTYGSWQYYSSTQHRRYGTCNDCGAGGKYEYASHSTTAQYTQYSDTQHKVTQHCDTCNSDIGSATYASHTYTYGSWEASSSTQHKRTKSCSLCGLSTEETGTHADTNADGQCDTCGYAMTATLTWDYGDGRTETTSQPYNAKLVLPAEPTKDGFTFSGWFTAGTGGERVDGETVFTADSPKTYYAQWAKIEVFSVSVPISLPLIADENGVVHTASAEIANNSTGAVKLSGLTLTAKNGWQFVPFATDMAHAKVDAKQIGFQINGAQTSKTDTEETFSFSSPWKIPEAGTLPVDYSAVVSAVSQPVTGQDVLAVVFMLEWAEG